MNSFLELTHRIHHCELCPRLRAHCIKVAQVKRAAYKDQRYWGKPVSGFGDKKARIWIVGLAPGAHGANRTGRVFTGDKSGEWLYSALFKEGWSSSPISKDRHDSLKLNHVYISCVVRCAPPNNHPSSKELKLCFPYLKEEWSLLNQLSLIICLGKTAFDQIKILMTEHYQETQKPRWKFAHGALYKMANTQVLVSYHPSQQNTQTGRLTREMWTTIFKTARQLTRTPCPD